LMERMLEVIRRRRLIVALPWWLARLNARVLDGIQGLSGGVLVNSLLTRDQVKMLGHDNVVAAGARGFGDLGIEPIAMEAVLDSYLYAYRPSGQYDEIKESAVRFRA